MSIAFLIQFLIVVFKIVIISILNILRDSIADDMEENAVDGFVRKCILLLDEFNYIEWQNQTCRAKRNGGKSGGVKVSGKRNYRIDPVLRAGQVLNLMSEKELMAMLRHEEKSFSSERKISSGKSPEDESWGEGTDTGEHTVQNTRSYVRRTNAWYVRGHYDHHGRYHRFRFATSVLPVGEDYLDYRKPI